MINPMVNPLPILLLSPRLAVCRLSPEVEIPDWARMGEFLSITRSRNELSIVCEEKWVPPEAVAERGWRIFQVEGTLDFAIIGVLADISRVLANANVSLFVVSTYDTDYILVKATTLERAVRALQMAGYPINGIPTELNTNSLQSGPETEPFG